MKEKCKKIFWSGLLAGVAMFVVGMALWYVFELVFPSLKTEYNNLAIFRPWSDPLMSLFFAQPLILGWILAWVWEKTKGVLSGSTETKVWQFAFGYWLVGSLPGMIMSWSSFQLSWLIVLTWLVSGLVNGLVAGWVFAKMNK